MTAAPRPDGGSSGYDAAHRTGAADTQPRLTIGEVLATLRGEFPDVTISKIRYLEAEDLVHPQRTPSGYRKFSTADVARLRYVLAEQRDHYLPLRVIKEQLDALDRGEAPASGTTRVSGQPPVPGPDVEPGSPEPEVAVEPAVDDVDGSEPLTAEDFGAAAGLTPDQLADCVQYGLLTAGADGRHPVADLAVARAAGGLARHGIEARHLRVYRSAAEREAALLEQVVAPVLRGRTGDARTGAADTLRELAALSAQLHTALLAARLREVLGPDLRD